MTTRRTFFKLMPVACTALCATSLSRAQSATLDPKDPQAVALGYVVDGTKVDKAKYPKHEASQTCATCQLYGGAAGSARGPCPIYQNKLVAAKGWCGTWVKKA